MNREASFKHEGKHAREKRDDTWVTHGREGQRKVEVTRTGNEFSEEKVGKH